MFRTRRSGRCLCPPARIAGGMPAVALLLVAGAMTAQTGPSSQTAQLSLAEVLREISARSTPVLLADLDVRAAQEGMHRAEAALRPTVSVSGGYQVRDHAIVGRFADVQIPQSEKSFFAAEVSATQTLWDGGRRAGAVTAARSAAEATAVRGRANVVSAQIEGLGAYLRILALDEQRTVLAQRAASLQDHLRLVNDLFAQGVVARNDVLDTEVRLRTVEDQTSQVDNDEALATQELNRLLGRAPGDPLGVAFGMPPPRPLPGDAAVFKDRARAANQQILALRARLKAQQDTVALRASDGAPTVFGEAAHTYQQNRNLVYPNATLLFLGLAWKPYDGGERKAAVREAEFAAARTRQEIADLERSVEIQIEQAFREYTQALREAATAERNIAAASESLRIEEDQYRAGLARSTDVLDAEAVLAESRLSLVKDHFKAYLRQGALLALAGDDLPGFFASIGSPGQER